MALDEVLAGQPAETRTISRGLVLPNDKIIMILNDCMVLPYLGKKRRSFYVVKLIHALKCYLKVIEKLQVA
jgi:hypothetical protein